MSIQIDIPQDLNRKKWHDAKKAWDLCAKPLKVKPFPDTGMGEAMDAVASEMKTIKWDVFVVTPQVRAIQTEDKLKEYKSAIEKYWKDKKAKVSKKIDEVGALAAKALLMLAKLDPGKGAEHTQEFKKEILKIGKSAEAFGKQFAALDPLKELQAVKFDPSKKSENRKAGLDANLKQLGLT